MNRDRVTHLAEELALAIQTARDNGTTDREAAAAIGIVLAMTARCAENVNVVAAYAARHLISQ